MISIVAAVAKNGVIGAKNDLPWYLPEDLKHFKKITNGHTVLMGRKTYESIVKRLGKPLPNRKNVLITRQTDYAVPEGVIVYSSVDEAFKNLKGENIYIIGGGEIFRETIDKTDMLYITHVERDVEGDVYFQEIDLNVWKLVDEEKHDGFRFAEYRRKD